MPKPVNADELRNRFKAASRLPQLLECRDIVCVAMRQTSDEMDANGETGDGMAELQGLFAQMQAI
jgi:hypothetical protein